MTSDDYKRLAAVYGDCCPTCALNWQFFPPAKIDGADKFRCIECKAVYPALRLAAEPVKAGEPVAWRWRYEDWDSWLVRQERPRHADDVDVVCEPLYTAPPASDVLREALVRELEACKSAVAMIEENRNPNNETQTGNYHFYRGRVVSLEFARDALAQAANQSDGGDKAGSSPILANKEEQRAGAHGVTPVGNYADAAGCTEVGPSDADYRRNLRHWKEECGKLHSQIAAKNAALDTALGALQIARVWIHKEQKRAPVLRAIEQIKRVRQ